MEDIVPSLLDKIATDFDLKVGADNEIEVLLGKITSGKGNLHHRYGIGRYCRTYHHDQRLCYAR